MYAIGPVFSLVLLVVGTTFLFCLSACSCVVTAFYNAGSRVGALTNIRKGP